MPDIVNDVEESKKTAKKIIVDIKALHSLEPDFEDQLRKLKNAVIKLRRDVNIAKTVGNSTAVVAGATGLLLAPITVPFTAGLCVALSVVAIAGAVTSIGTDIADAVQSSGFKKDIVDILDKYREKVQQLQESLKEFNKQLFASQARNPELNSGGLDEFGIAGNVVGITKEVLQAVYAVGSMSALQGANAAAKVTKFSRMAKFGGPVLFAITAVIDVVDTVQGWTGKDPQVSAIDDTIEKMSSSLEELVKYKKELQKWCEEMQ